MTVLQCNSCGAMAKAPSYFDMYTRVECKCGNVVQDSYQPIRAPMLAKREASGARWRMPVDWKGNGESLYVTIVMNSKKKKGDSWWDRIKGWLG